MRYIIAKHMVSQASKSSLVADATAVFSRTATGDGVGLSARTANVKVAAFFSKFAIPIELVILDTNLLLLPALRGGITASPCVVPLPLSWAVRAAGGGVVHALGS